jgi:hypothetical protein
VTRAAALLLCVLIPVAAAASLTGCRRSGTDWRVQSLLGGGDNTETVGAPTEVYASRVSPQPTSKAAPSTDEKATGPFRIETAAVPVDAEVAARLAAIFSDADTYDWQRAKRTVWTPRVGLTFVRHGRRVELLLCLDSDQMLIFVDDKLVGNEDTDTARPALLTALRAALPHDEYLAGLGE